jgi:hypothetical protein
MNFNRLRTTIKSLGRVAMTFLHLGKASEIELLSTNGCGKRQSMTDHRFPITIRCAFVAMKPKQGLAIHYTMILTSLLDHAAD